MCMLTNQKVSSPIEKKNGKGGVREQEDRQTCDLFAEGNVNEMTKYLRNGLSFSSTADILHF